MPVSARPLAYDECRGGLFLFNRTPLRNAEG